MPARRFLSRVHALPQKTLVTLVRGYRLFLSPWLGSSCRFAPTCSMYAIEALERHGAIAGSALTVGRIARCHPWCAGGHDPVPPAPRLFAFLRSPAAADADAGPEASARPPSSLSVEKNVP